MAADTVVAMDAVYEGVDACVMSDDHSHICLWQMYLWLQWADPALFWVVRGPTLDFS